MEKEKRMAGDYEIIQAFHIGDREIVIGENPNAAPDERFMCAFCEKNEIAALHSEVMVRNTTQKLFSFSPSVLLSRRRRPGNRCCPNCLPVQILQSTPQQIAV